MGIEQPSAPSTWSRASTMVRDSIEEGQPAMAQPVSSVQGTYDTPPRTTPTKTNDDEQVPLAQNSMQHIITIFYGEELRSWCSIHEQILCKHSKKMKDFSVKAVATRKVYSKINDWLEQIESITVLDTTPQQFEEQKLGAKLIALILNIWNNFPIGDYQNPISKAIRDAVDLQYANSNLISSAERPKTLKVFQGFSSNRRLQLLNSEGLLEVAEEVCSRLQRCKAAEKRMAKRQVVKAWAHGQLNVRGASEKSVVSLVEWAYHKTLSCENAEHLYDLWTLATRLQLDVLAEDCMDRLYHSTSASLFDTFSNGVPLRYLLGLSKEQNTPDLAAQPVDVVAAVFRHVLKDENPPPKLSKLVIDALARGMDSELWIQLQSLVNLDTAHKLIEVMIAYREERVEQDLNERGLIKREGPEEGHNAQPKPIEPQQQPALTG